MLHLLFYLLLQLGLLEGPSNPQLPAKSRNQITTQPSGGIPAQQTIPGGGTSLETDNNIGGSGWDDKN